MKFKPRAVQQVGTSLLLVLILLEVLLALIYLAGVFLTGKAYPLFDMDGLMTIPSFLQAFQLLLVGLIGLSLLIIQPPSSPRLSRLFLLTVAVLFIYGAIDEVFKIHLQLHRLFHTPSNRDWLPFYFGIGVTTIVMFYRDFVAIWRFRQKAIAFIALGMGIFILGGFGAELLKHELVHTVVSQISRQDELIPVLVEKLRVAVEEFSELLGESITLYGIFLYVAKRLSVNAYEAAK
ncbi:MAG: hypothetical protein F6K28_25250 [Microcoleus sp. SIO2G3]|nr:hypothetical protein [Microcoleus sp. SIO2G3]